VESEKPKGRPLGEVRAKAPDSCPHCGAALSPWEQVLLSVDRALMCKHCWYRIILDVHDQNEKKQ
jgi:DNA-directed RNA polymerase subunit RPC12/RpoP